MADELRISEWSSDVCSSDLGDRAEDEGQMIAKLKGLLDSTGTDHAIIDVQGVGYLVGASSRTLAALGRTGEACTVYTEMLVSQDSIRLMGLDRKGVV